MSRPSRSETGVAVRRGLRLHRLPTVTVDVAASQLVVFQVISSAGREIERRPDGARLVEFEAMAGDRKIITKELVWLHPDERIDYEWVDGPLPVVIETITITPRGEGVRVRYEGRFAVEARWPKSIPVRRTVRRYFASEVRAHLETAKTMAEQRWARIQARAARDRGDTASS